MVKNKKIIILILVLIVVTVSVAVVVALINKGSNKIETTVYVTPSDAKIVLDKSTSISNGKNYISAGNHTISASRSGFTSKKLDFIVQKNSVNIFTMILDTNSSVGTQYLNDHKDEITKLEAIGSQQYTSNSNLIGENYPFIKDLPIDISPLYRIDYGTSKKYPNDPTKIAIYVSAASPKDKQLALSTIYDKAYDPSDYEIIFESLQE